MKRITTLIALFPLLISMILPVCANDHTRIDSNHAHCSTGGNSIGVVVNGNTVKISGKLVYEGLDMIWLRCGDDNYVNLPHSKLVPISAGEYFSVTLDVSALDEESEIRILYSTKDMDSFYYHHSHALYSIKPSADGWQLYASPNRKHEGEDNLDAVLGVFTSNASYINAPVTYPETVKTITTNTTDNNHVTVIIEGNKAIISGSVVYDNLSSIWCRWGDTNKVGLPNSKLIDAESGKPFSVELDLSGITEPTYIDVLASTTDDTQYWFLYSHHFLVKPTSDGYALCSAPLLKHNLELQKQWINLAEAFNAKITDAVQKKSDEICKGITDDYSKLWALHQWVAKNVYYDYDCFYGQSAGVHDPDDVLRTRAAVCQGYAELLEALIEAQGIPAILVYDYASITDDLDFWKLFDVPSAEDSNHIHVEAFVDMRWVTMDATWDSKNEYFQGKYEPHDPTSWEYFDVSNEDFAFDHIILSREFEQDITDIPASWAAGEVLEAMAQHLVPAELQSDYAIGITRTEFSKLIVQLLREKGVKITLDSKLKFNDTNDPDVLAAASAGIVSGVGDGKFNPNALITREQAATMLARAAKVLGIEGSSPIEFSDINRAADWAKDSIRLVSSLVSGANRRVMGGVGNGFDPQGSYTRQQAILTVVRLANCK